MDEYNCNNDFKMFVDKYCAKSLIAPEEAMQHYIVKEVESYYRFKRTKCKNQ
jgi:hypothetical protein